MAVILYTSSCSVQYGGCFDLPQSFCRVDSTRWHGCVLVTSRTLHDHRSFRFRLKIFRTSLRTTGILVQLPSDSYLESGGHQILLASGHQSRQKIFPAAVPAASGAGLRSLNKCLLGLPYITAVPSLQAYGRKKGVRLLSVFTARCTLVQSAVLRSHVVCLSVRPSVRL